MEIIAHRGASHTAPENTVCSAKLAWAEGADALEVDVRLTADGQLAVLHDADTRRVAGEALTVREVSLAQLQNLDVGRWKHALYAGEKIPGLPEILTSVPAGKRLFIELKGGPELVVPLEKCLRQSLLTPSQAVVISFDLHTLAAAKKTLPLHPCAWILQPEREAPLQSSAVILNRCREHGIDGLDLSAEWPIDAALVRQVHEADLKLYVWTVDDSAVARRLQKAGVDGIATNRPAWLRAQL